MLSSIETNCKEVDFYCEKHGFMRAKIFLFGEKEIGPDCQHCLLEKTIEEKQSSENRRKSQEEWNRKILIGARLSEAMIPIRFQQHSFESYSERSPEVAKKKAFCLNYAKNFDDRFKKGVSLIFTGTTGAGKTHLACAIANFIIKEHNKTAVFLSVMNAVRRVKETYSRKSEETERQAIAHFLKPDLLILDEVGVQFGSKTEEMILFEIINQRYENLKPTFLISNLSAEKLEEFVGERIMDRMKENGGSVIAFDMESYRGAK